VVASVLLYFVGGLLGKAASLVTQPVYLARHWITESGGTVPSFFRSQNELIGEINTLREQLAAGSGKNATLSRVLAENDELRSLLNIADTKRIVAGVIGRPPNLPYDSLLIDQGSGDGVREGAVVYHGDDHAIGYVSRAYSATALVTLFSTPGVEATAYIFGPDIYATVYGEGGGVIRISVPQGITLTKGDVVVMPTLEGGVIGSIEEIESVPTQPEQHAFIIGSIPIQSIRLLSVSTRVIESISFEEAENAVTSFDVGALTIDVPEAILANEEGSTTTATSTDITDINEGIIE
jgi:cell shape-determining protein MreC